MRSSNSMKATTSNSRTTNSMRKIRSNIGDAGKLKFALADRGLPMGKVAGHSLGILRTGFHHRTT